MGNCGVILSNGETEWKLLHFLYADSPVLLANLEEELDGTVGQFDDVRRRRLLKVISGIRKGMEVRL